MRATGSARSCGERQADAPRAAFSINRNEEEDYG
jgi:hypothetical protein